jgi:hypothetical protein
MQPRVGGSFAPPLDADKLAAYRELAEGAGGAVGYTMLQLCAMAEAFLEHPPAKGAGTPHPSGAPIAMVPLSKETVEALDPHVPWPHECDAMAQLFEGIDPAGQRDLRNAAHHLLWYARELTLDRRPLTADLLNLPEGG